MGALAISDLHVDYSENAAALERLPHYPDDWLLLAGDITHRPEDLVRTLRLLLRRFRRLVWVPGNHELWTVPNDSGAGASVGEARYQQLVALCRSLGVLTPEDPYPVVEHDGRAYVIAPLFLLYDYSFRPPGVALEDAVSWAAESDVICADEYYLKPDPYPSRARWCEERCRVTESRLAEIPPAHRLILVNHFSLREDLVRMRIPRFRIWCGTRRTEDWHRRFNVAAVVTGHLHVRASDVRDGVRFEEVSLGYPRQWRRERGVAAYLRRILPPEDPPRTGWRP